jgi:carboxymethylenebutenolidase
MNELVRDGGSAVADSPFAAAAQPVAAHSVIHTDTDGLSAGLAHIDVGGQAVPLYHARPEGKGKPPVILVVSEIFGLHEHIADVARRFAKQGYMALAPDLFVRQGDATRVPVVADLMRDIVSQTPDAQVLGDLDACVAWAANNGGNVDKLGITGFCWGGRITWLYAAHNPGVKAGVAWYGRLLGAVTPNNPRHPVDIAPTLAVPVLGLYGAQDTGIPVDTVDTMKAALAKGSSGSDFVVYPDAGHAFHADYRPAYNEKDARDGWRRALDWFKRHGVA